MTTQDRTANLRRPLTDDEKRKIVDIHGSRCYIDGHPIAADDDLEFDHVRPVAVGGPTSLENMAPVCRKHNRQKGKMALWEYRDYLKLGRFFSDGEMKYLDDIITATGQEFGASFQIEVDDASQKVVLYFEDGQQAVSLYQCPATSWHYFHALIPIRYLKNDVDLQPRPLRQSSLWGLYRHFQRNTQIAPSICRYENGQLLLFDGQHKAAAQIWAGRLTVECKVYIDPEPSRLKETNLEAHQSYRQMSFYSYELMKKYADICGEDWEEYAGLEGRKSEAGFVQFLIDSKAMTTTMAKKEVAKAIHWRILNDSGNTIGEFVSEKSRARRQPLTYNRIEKTIFRLLLSPIPSKVEFQSPDDYRDIEERNLVILMTILAEEGLIDKWDPALNDAMHQRTERIFSAGSIRAWTRVLRDVLNAYLQLFLRGPEEIERVLYRDVTEEQFDWFRKFIRQIFTHAVWDAPDTADQDISKSLTKDDDTTAMSLLRERGLTTEWVLQSAGGQ